MILRGFPQGEEGPGGKNDGRGIPRDASRRRDGGRRPASSGGRKTPADVL